MSDNPATKPTGDNMVIREIAAGVTTVSVPFARGPFKFGGRATIVKLSSGNLAVFSPVALTPNVQSTLTTLGGPVSYIAAPDIEHHIHLSAWAAAFPKAHLIAPEGLAEKRAQANQKDKSVTVVPFSTIFTKANKSTVKVSEEFDADFEYEFVDAHLNKELVFFHKKTGTLIEADLMFNLPGLEQYSKTGEDATSGIAAKISGALMGTKGAAKWQKRLQWYGFSKSDRAGYAASVQRINGWGINNIVPCHGDTILGDGKAVFEMVFAWHLVGKNA